MENLPLIIGQLSAAPGEKTQGYLPVAKAELALPITIINGKQAGKILVILSGIHGGEYLGIETAIQLAKQIKADSVNGAVILVHPVNTAAFYDRLSYVNPLDHKNLNRVFPGKLDGSVSERIAFTITNELFAKADFFIDLHGGDLHEALVPFTAVSLSGDGEVDRLSKESANLMGFEYNINMGFPGTTFGTAAAMAIPGFLAEFGQCGRWQAEDVQRYFDAIQNVLKHIGVLSAEPVVPLNKVKELTSFETVYASASGCWYPFLELGAEFSKGEQIGEIRDVFTEPLQACYAPCNGSLIVLTKSLAVKKGDPIFGIGQHPNSTGKKYV